MDDQTPENLFAQTTDIKNMKSGSSTLEVYVSIGGWTFSDNHTATQSVFPEIASDTAKRQKFADNLVNFMVRYGFDGVDLDWEYPGAPDRGGKEEDDLDNSVALTKTLRETFKSSARGNYGLTFTIPSSHWYLKWFDVPRLLEYADWTKLMSYDLHGEWDKDNPIGNIVQGHTNLTEIKLATDLLWRNNVPPEKVVLGVGFYGRSFRLGKTSCSKPGCEFSSNPAADPGVCTESSGTLAYFEIMDIIEKQKPKIVYEEESAVNYIVYGDKKNQWVSYDDKLDAPQQATSDVVRTGTISSTWDDTETHIIGSVPSPRVVFEGGEQPDERQPPNLNGYALFGDREFMSCGSGSSTGKLICHYNISAYDEDLLDEPHPLYKFRIRDSSDPFLSGIRGNQSDLEKRGPNTGPAATYYAIENPPSPGGNPPAFRYETPNYPNEENGNSLDEEQGRPAGTGPRYALSNAADCVDTTITSQGARPQQWVSTNGEHPEDRSILPNHYLSDFVQTGQMDLAGGTYTTPNQQMLVPFQVLFDHFAVDYRVWATNVQDVPRGSAMSVVADAHGSSSNPTVMSNLEADLNRLKGRIYTTEGRVVGEIFDTWASNPSRQNADNALSALRAAFGVFNYMNAIRGDRQRVRDDVHTALADFDRIFAQQFPNNPARMVPLYLEFTRQWDIRVVNFVQNDIISPLNQLERAYRPYTLQPTHPLRPLAVQVVAHWRLTEHDDNATPGYFLLVPGTPEDRKPKRNLSRRTKVTDLHVEKCMSGCCISSYLPYLDGIVFI
ncbi:hypothetical protein AC579_2627 [Pseudocercospora musae]|uniref:chitinase n=1 Tax=Pseudocercospora musae TaxID=113226 RepID=A0A139IH55_9PEZI|nr:hypothetical protein AC579_2627 [Pseudocercospora musae]